MKKYSYRIEEYFYSFLSVKRVYVLFDYPYLLPFLKRRRLIVSDKSEFKCLLNDKEFKNLKELPHYTLG